MQILELNPIYDIKCGWKHIKLFANYSMYDAMNYGINSISDYSFKNFGKFGVFLYDKIDIPNILDIDPRSSKIIYFEIVQFTTTTDASMMNQTVVFDITFFDTLQINGSKKDLKKVFVGTILTPHILIENNHELILCIIIDDIVKTRNKKIQKIIEKTCQV